MEILSTIAILAVELMGPIPQNEGFTEVPTFEIESFVFESEGVHYDPIFDIKDFNGIAKVGPWPVVDCV